METKKVIIVTDNNNVPLLSDDGSVTFRLVGDEDTSSIAAKTPNNNSNEVDFKKLEWTDGATRFLLDLYAESFPQIGPMKKFRTRNHMWKFVATKISNELNFPCNETQCDSRFKSIIRATNMSLKHNTKSGNDPKNVPWETEIRRIRAMDDSLEPRIMRGVGISVHTDKNKRVEESDEVKKYDERKSETRQPEKIVRKKSMVETFAEIAEDREKNKKKRHEEKLQLLREALAGNKNQ